MKRKPSMILAAALLCGGAAGSLAFIYQKQLPERRNSGPPTVSIVLAARDLSVGNVIADSDLTTIRWPADQVPEGATDSKKALLGRSIVEPIGRNEPVTARDVSEKGVGGGLLGLVPSGMRAFTVNVGDATFVSPGSNVDIIGALGSGQSRVILQDVKVLAVGNTITPPNPNEPIKPATSNMITLLVSPAEAEVMAVATHQTTLHLSLRNNIDSADGKTPGARLANLFSEPAPEPSAKPQRPVVHIPPPAPPKNVNDTVDMYRRASKSTITLKKPSN